jgi:hypothetical protein
MIIKSCFKLIVLSHYLCITVLYSFESTFASPELSCHSLDLALSGPKKNLLGCWPVPNLLSLLFNSNSCLYSSLQLKPQTILILSQVL